jgi:DNA-binding SARP family transcriptional activator/TolB-like protein/Tfp pilus assembly protein PilF
MRPLIQIKLLGEFALRNGGAVVLPSKVQALLAWLTLTDGKPVKREVIRELLWPDRGEDPARHSLRQALFVLRRDGFGGREVVESRDNAISLQRDCTTCDVHELREMLQPGSDASWQAIVALYDSPLLNGFPPISSEFDDFVTGERRKLEAAVLAALGRHADAADSCGDAAHQIAIRERMLAIDPLREDSHRGLIAAYAHAGRRADAIRIYDEAKALLRREMDVAPANETEALIADIRDGRPANRERFEMTLPAAPALSGPPRIAVLPLRQSEDQPLASHLSDGITADIITQLAGLRELTVISHGSTFSFRDPHMEPQVIGQKLNARYLVIGRIRRGGDRIRLTTELTEAETGQIVFSHTDNAYATMSFDDQDRIVARLVNALVPQVRETELRRIRGKRPKVLSVYEKILLSREYILQLDRDRFGEAKRLLDDVIEDDPGYGEAYALAAEWHSTMAGEGWSADRNREIELVEKLNRTALDLDNCNLRALVSYGYRKSIHHRDHASAIRTFHQALDVAPSSANAWALSGLCFAFAGEAAEAVRHASRALELSPYDRESYKFFHALCVAHYTEGDYERATEWGLRALGENNVWRATVGFTAASLAALGRLSEAQEITAQIGTKWPVRRICDIMNSTAYRDPGRRKLYGEHLRAAGYPD